MKPAKALQSRGTSSISHFILKNSIQFSLFVWGFQSIFNFIQDNKMQFPQ
jgi:hypothetical protein